MPRLSRSRNRFKRSGSGGKGTKLAKNPKLLLCDEPTGALDYNTGKNILRLLYDVSKKNGKLVIVVTHNQALKDMADKVIFIKNGAIEKIEVNEKPKPIEEIEW